MNITFNYKGVTLTEGLYSVKVFYHITRKGKESKTMTWYDIEIKIEGLETKAPEYYLKALMCHVRHMVMQELNNAPDCVVMTYDKVEATGTVRE